MKHNIKTVLILVALFLMAQYIGLLIINNSDILPYDLDRPVFSEQFGFLQLFGYVIVASVFALLIAFLSFEVVWRIIFFISVFFCLTIAFGAFMPDNLAALLAFLFAVAKIFRLSLWVHNFGELFIYGGLAAIFVPAITLGGAALLLILISVYDAIAVWKTKHMIKLAKFQTKVNLFTGLLVPSAKNKVAMLGGGDIGFPLIFIGAAYLAIGAKALIIPIFTSIALYLLLYYGDKGKFYPAMPFISAGVFAGYLVTLLI
ncbi:MAG: presenilin family intramembrane aspartyl protease [Candidatus Nanoarchaeia archaeon]|nr:presenilin family intramembrane aspartyl protease [Candidatus Nanoarchaeia archaeon]